MSGRIRPEALRAAEAASLRHSKQAGELVRLVRKLIRRGCVPDDLKPKAEELTIEGEEFEDLESLSGAEVKS